MYDLIVLKSVCTVIQEYCRRKYCVLISYDLKWEELAMIVCEKERKWKIHLFIRNKLGARRQDMNYGHLSQ